MSVRAADESTEMLLADYLEGNLSPNRRAEIDAYLAAHPKERAVIDQLAAQRGLLAALPRETAPPDVREAVQSQLERSMLLESLSEIGSEKAVGMRSRPQTLALAAMIVLSLGMGVAIYSIIAPPSRGPQLGDKYAVGNPSPAPTTGSGHSPGGFGPVTLSQGAGVKGGTTGLDAAVGGNTAAHILPGVGPFAPRSSATSRPDPFRTPEPEITFARRAGAPGGAASVSADASQPGAMSKAAGPVAAAPSPTVLRGRPGESAAAPRFGRGAVTVYVDDLSTAPARLEQLLTASGLPFTRVPAAEQDGQSPGDAWNVRLEPGQEAVLDAMLRRVVTTPTETGPAAPGSMSGATTGATPNPMAAFLSPPAAGVAGEPATRPATEGGLPSTRSGTPSDEDPARKSYGDAPGPDQAGGTPSAKSVRVELRLISPRRAEPTTSAENSSPTEGAPATRGTDKPVVDPDRPAGPTTVPSDPVSPATKPTTKPAGFSG